MKAAAA